jgi:hypothetical protein
MAPIYNEPIDWSNAVHCTFSTNNHTGYIEGISKEVCFVWLEKLEKEQGWHADKNTFVGSEIEGFWAKYYKFIPGGYKIRFIYK